MYKYIEQLNKNFLVAFRWWSSLANWASQPFFDPFQNVNLAFEY